MALDYDFITGNIKVSTPCFTRNNFEATDGQTVFNLTFLLKAGANVVFVNGAPVDENTYTGTGTMTLTFNNPLQLYDKVLVIG